MLQAPYLFQPETGEVIHLSEALSVCLKSFKVYSKPQQAGDPLLEHIRRDLPEDVRELHMVEADLEVLEDERVRQLRGQACVGVPRMSSNYKGA